MRYTTEVTIDMPRTRVVALFDDPDNLPKWEEGLLSMRPVAGVPGEPGAVSELVYETKPGKTMNMTETIEVRALPAEFIAVYEARGMWNRHASFFHEDGPDRTRYVIETELRFRGITKALSLFMRKAFERETLRGMLAFKAFCENA